MSDRIWRGDAVAVVQIVTITPGTVVAGKEYALRINGKRVAVTTGSTSAAALLTALAEGVNASSIPEWREVVAEASGSVLTLTGRTAGVPFVVYAEAGGFTANGAVVITVRNAPTGGTWEYNGWVYGKVDVTYNSSAATLQGQLDTLYGAGNTLVTLAIDGTDRVYSVSFIGTLAAAPVPSVSVAYDDLTGGDAALVVDVIQPAVPGTDEVQTITFVGASAGTWKLSFDGSQTASLAYNISTAALQTAIQLLPSVGSGNATVSGTAGTSYVIAFAGARGHANLPLITIDDSALTAAQASVAETTPGAEGSATSTGPRLAGTGADAGTVNSMGWGAPGNITVTDGTTATCTIPPMSSPATFPSGYLLASNFGFAIPTDATILGLEVVIKRKTTSGATTVDTAIEFVLPAGTVSNNNSAGASWPSSLTNATFGGSTDLWGVTLTPAIVNDAALTLRLRCLATTYPSSYNQAEVDSVTLKVYHTDPTTGTNEVQTLSISGSPSAGEFSLAFNGESTGHLPYNATALQVQTALRGLSTIGETGVVCSGGALPGTPVVITFGGPLAYENVALIVATNYGVGWSVVETTPGVTGLNEIQRLSLAGQEVWGGTLTLTWSGQTSGAVAFDALPTEVEAALVALSNIAPADVICTGGPWPESPINVEWAGAQAEVDVAAITSTSSLKNGIASRVSFDPLIQSVAQRATGPNHWNDGTNWYNPASPTETLCPQRQDTVYITEGSTDILYGLIQMVDFTVDTSAEWIIPAGPHDLQVGQIVEVWTTSALPAGLSAATAYHVIALSSVTGRFKLAASAGGAAVNITGSGTGTHTVGVRLDRWFQASKYTGNVGLPWTNESGYKEYRPLYATVGFNPLGTNSITIGQGDGSGTSRTNINTGTEALALFEVLNSGGSRETGIPSVNWIGDNTATVVQVLGGDLGIAMRPTETAQFASLVLREGSVGLGTVEFATLDQTGGALGPVTALTLSGVAKIRG